MNPIQITLTLTPIEVIAVIKALQALSQPSTPESTNESPESTTVPHNATIPPVAGKIVSMPSFGRTTEQVEEHLAEANNRYLKKQEKLDAKKNKEKKKKEQAQENLNELPSSTIITPSNNNLKSFWE